MSPALQPLLSKLRRETPAEAEHLVSVVQPASYNLRTRFERIVRRAGLQPWPRLFHNMRASCATDWAKALPAQVVAHAQASWLGHSPLVAAKHDLQSLMRLTDAHFEVAIRGGARTALQQLKMPGNSSSPA